MAKLAKHPKKAPTTTVDEGVQDVSKGPAELEKNRWLADRRSDEEGGQQQRTHSESGTLERGIGVQRGESCLETTGVKVVDVGALQKSVGDTCATEKLVADTGTDLAIVSQ